MRIAGVSVPSEKRLIISLQYIYGVGPARATTICQNAKLDENLRVKNLTPDQEEMLRATLTELGHVVEADLRREVTQNIRRLQEIGSYRGYRHRKRLPLRGQRTKTNARTRRGKKSTIANKKKVTK